MLWFRLGTKSAIEGMLSWMVRIRKSFLGLRWFVFVWFIFVLFESLFWYFYLLVQFIDIFINNLAFVSWLLGLWLSWSLWLSKLAVMNCLEKLSIFHITSWSCFVQKFIRRWILLLIWQLKLLGLDLKLKSIGDLFFSAE